MTRLFRVLSSDMKKTLAKCLQNQLIIDSEISEKHVLRFLPQVIYSVS